MNDSDDQDEIPAVHENDADLFGIRSTSELKEQPA
jgi:hypothetical protein